MSNKIDITVMFPTRGRPVSLERSLKTLLENAAKISNLEVLLGIDRDDQITIDHCLNVIKPWLESIGCSYKFLQFNRLGYAQLHRYINELAQHARGDWLFFYNDDAAMETKHWDQIILDNGDEFCLIRTETNHEHPYAIFPILPREWIEVTGSFSQHQLNDAWVSQIGWMLDIVKTIPVMIKHERFDLTGENQDSTYEQREIFEGDSTDPRDFNYVDMRKIRFNEANKIYQHLKTVYNRDMSWFEDSISGKNDVWSKMLSLDKKGLMKKYS
jgi:hypothetical protein